MKNFIRVVSIIALLAVFVHPNTSIAAGEQTDPDLNQFNIPSNKEWVIEFTEGVNTQDINEKNLYVKDENGNKVDTEKELINSNTLKVKAPNTGYKAGEVYVLTINKKLDVTNNDEQHAHGDYHIQFKIK